MTNNKKDKTAERVAQLEKELAEVKAALPKPQLSWEEQERRSREWAAEMHQMREARMSMAMHPSVIRDMAGGVSAADCAGIIKASHAPTGPSPMTPSSSPPVSHGRGSANVPGSGTGWAHSAPLGPPPGVTQADRLMDEADRRDRVELARRIAEQKAALGDKSANE
jgi:hypothetical protein